MHRLFEIDRIEYLDPVRLIYGFPILILHWLPVLPQFRRSPLQHLSAFREDRAFRSGSVKTEFQKNNFSYIGVYDYLANRIVKRLLLKNTRF